MENKSLVLRQHSQPCLQRVVVVGCCGAGKSTFSEALSRRLGVPHIERDTLGKLGSDDYRRAVADVVCRERWIFDGPPYFVEDLVYRETQQVIWLDYSRTCVLGQAIRRALRRTFTTSNPSKSEWGGWRQWVAPGGPLFANSVYAARKREFGQLQHRPELIGKVLHFDDPALLQRWLISLEGVEKQQP